MHPVAAAELERARPAIAALCRHYGIKHLWIFGSANGPSFDPDRSDFDFLAEYGPLPAGVRELHRLVRLPEEIAALVGRPVQIADWKAARNPFFRRSAERSRGLDYA